MYQVLVLAALVSGVLSQTQLNGTCGIKPGQAVPNVSVLKMLGKWYQMERIPNHEESGDCSTTTFELKNLFSGTLSNREVLADGTVQYRNGTIMKDKSTGQFTVTFDVIGFAIDFYVLATDYKNYALFYSCLNTSATTKNVWAWKVSRKSTLSSTYTEEIKAAITRNPDLQSVTWRQTRQANCGN